MTIKGSIRDYFNTRDFGCVHVIAEHANGEIKNIASVLTRMLREGRVGVTFEKKICDKSHIKHAIYHKTDKTFQKEKEWKKSVLKVKNHILKSRNMTKFIKLENEILKNQNEFLLNKIKSLLK